MKYLIDLPEHIKKCTEKFHSYGVVAKNMVWQSVADGTETAGTADEICENVCRWRIEAFETHKDVDDAEKFLDKNYCSAGCPVLRLR